MSSDPAPGFRLLVGLGNPGAEYRGTRHNVGFAVLAELASREGVAFHLKKSWQAEVARAGDLLLCKPLTYMNLSGEAVRPVHQFYKIEPRQVLVVLDDMALPLGKLRLRAHGSAGGHHGLQSIIDQLGTLAIPRLRIGIGSADHGAVDHVLGRFTLEETPVLEQSIDRALEAIACAQTEGLAAAMNLFN